MILGRLIERVDDDGGANEKSNTWTWDSRVEGRLSAKSRTGGFTENYFYDTLDRLDEIKTEITYNGGTDTMYTYQTYDSYGRPLQTTYPSDFKVKQIYNARGYLEAYRDGTSNALLHEVNARDAFGNITSEDYGNSRTTTSAFDSESGRVTSISTSSSSQSLSMVWRSNGILKKRTDSGVTETFSYDGLNRLTQGTSNNTGTDRTLSFSLDDLGNLTSKTSNIAGDVDATGYAYGGTTNAGPHAVSSVTVDGISHTLYYDANGNVTSIDAASGFDRSFAYNTFNKPTRVTLGNVSTPEAEETFEYGPDGARYLRKSVYDDGGGTITTWTLYLHGGVFEKIVPQSDATIDSIEKTRVSSVAQHTKTDPAGGTATEEMFYFYRDHLGSVNVIADDTGTVLDHLAFDPYGGRRMDDFTADISSTELDQVLDNRNERTGRGFTGHEHLDRTGVIHMNGRIFDPVIGRFLSADPVVQAPTFSQSYNRYAYTFNSPLSFVDPSGYQTGREPLHDGIDMTYCGGQCRAAQSLTKMLNKRRISRMLHDYYGSIEYFEPGAPGIYGIVTSLLGKDRANELYGFEEGTFAFQAEGVALAQQGGRACGGRPCVDRQPNPNGPLYSFGANAEINLVAPILSNGGGVFGVNLQYIEDKGLPQSWWVIIAPFRRDKAQAHPDESKWHCGIVAYYGIRGHVPSPS